MEIKFFGGNCIKISTKKSTVIIDDNLEVLGKKAVTTNKDISVNTNPNLKYTVSDYFVINSPGEYELSEISVKGIPSKLHYDPQSNKAIMYSIHVNGFSIAVLGHTVANLSDEQLEEFGVVDILIIPVGGNGYTIDPIESVKIIKEVEPKLVIPTHYASKGIKYEVPQQDLEEFIKVSGFSEAEAEESLKLKDNNLPEKTRVVILTEQQ